MSKLLKAQIWYYDFLLALSMFLLILVFSFKYINDTYIFEAGESTIPDADKLAGKLMSYGVPNNWTKNEVISIGILTNGVLNSTKLNNFNNLTIEDYASVKQLMGIKSDFLIYFENQSNQRVNFSDSGYIGMAGATPSTLDGRERINIERYVVYKEANTAKILTMKVVVWQ